MMFATAAYAQAAGGQPISLLASPLFMMVPIIGIMYFLMIRPQQKKLKDHRALVAALRRGDQVVTSGGIIGKVSKVSDGELEVEIATGVKVRVVKHTVTQVLSKTEPAA